MSRTNCNNLADTGNRCGNNAGGNFFRRCECVYVCLLELLENALENNNSNCSPVRPGCGIQRRCDCQCVYECLLGLLEEELGNDNCRCPR